MKKKTSLYHLPFTIWAHEWNYWRFLMGDDVCVCGNTSMPFAGCPEKANQLRGQFQL